MTAPAPDPQTRGTDDEGDAMTEARTDQVVIEVTWNIPGNTGKSIAKWPVSDEPAPHRVMAANVLRKLADELEADD